MSRTASPAAGPWTIASATARFSVTTGLSSTSDSSRYRPRICRRSVGAVAWTAAIAACS
ncbi:hypothetical protein [Dactylosporangium sp. NPDC005555]|uniref:hypothetical protein n=1 Tax=Dactylosporangium sp. NPDC005555 TaxID=3154889 RepID=UPI0033BD2D00